MLSSDGAVVAPPEVQLARDEHSRSDTWVVVPQSNPEFQKFHRLFVRARRWLGFVLAQVTSMAAGKRLFAQK